MSVLAAYICGCCDHRSVLAPGERGQLPVLAASMAQAGSFFAMVRGVFDAVPRLRPLVEATTADTIRLSSLVDIVVRPASFRTVRSSTAVSAIGDEVAFWRDAETSANPDHEVIGALRPALLTTGGMFIAISSPYAQRGELYKAWRKNFGEAGHPRRLVMQASSLTMNSTLPAEEIDEAYADDPARAAAEYGGQFRQDVQQFLTREAVDLCTPLGVFERPPITGTVYTAFVDPAGGSGTDSMTLAIGHREKDIAVLDLVREVRPPFNPEAATADLAADCLRYGVRHVTGDRYAGEWPRDAFRRRGIGYQLSDYPKSQIYSAFLPLINAGRVDLLDHKRLDAQLIGLERRTARGGRDSIDHTPGGHDDLANVVAGVLAEAAVKAHTAPVAAMGWYRTVTYGDGGGYLSKAPPPDWVQRGDRFPPGDPRWHAWNAEQDEMRRQGELG